ncbi:hypothetical protein AOQ84DRAFT_222089 [Glonium stellatum]|uniref:Uncharacterized protein n=1 Tax=Glonium stellatum TaxID=574774 RepID=A0A8E2F0C7_9PEZI|nr:hypothetical protein AOQ84DRAFT_222089 [Glonium stellatum]
MDADAVMSLNEGERNLKIRVVVQTLNQQYHLKFSDILPTESGQQVMRRIRNGCQKNINPYSGRNWIIVWLRKSYAGLATLSSLAPPDIEVQDRSVRVGVGEIQHTRELTFAFFHADTLSPTVSFASMFPDVVASISSGSNLTLRKAIVVGQGVNRLGVCYIFAGLVAVSISTGVAIAFLCHSLEAGIASGAAMIGLLAVLEGLVVWMMK